VYFALYELADSDVVAHFWDTNGADGWSATLPVSRGVYVLDAAGTAVDIEVPVAFDWLVVAIL
jgi:hypothetical protein